MKQTPAVYNPFIDGCEHLLQGVNTSGLNAAQAFEIPIGDLASRGGYLYSGFSAAAQQGNSPYPGDSSTGLEDKTPSGMISTKEKIFHR